MKKFMYSSLIVCFAAFVSCKTETITTIEENNSDETRVEEAQELTNFPFTFTEVAIEGDTLIAQVQYSGGCGNHEFEIEKVGFLMKSLPPKQPIKITHRSDGDPCRALIREELKFNVSDFRGTPDGTTVLLLENWTQHIIYSY
jgi:hypothetical protein